MKLFITRKDLYKPELVKYYLPWEEAVHMLNKERLMFNAHFYGYNLIGEDPRKKENYELTEESKLMAKAVATVLLNEKYAFKERKLPVVIHEGNTVFVENAIPGVEFVYEAIKQELEKHGENVEDYFILKDPYNTDTWGEIKFLMKQSQIYKPDAIISLAFP
ncbi:MAG: hypothetical protein GXN99_00430, partial [Candidatus Nanohaloarchaeota archaeon]|nr:hypothetical protein [Candidatus Nanohaloarchaeota archaeon]